MTQAIVLPSEMAKGYIDDAHYRLDLEKLVKDYAREVAVVAIILSDNYMKELYETPVGYHGSYMTCIDLIHEWAVEFVHKYAHVEEWEEFCATQTDFENIMCWDDMVIAFGNKKIKE